MSVAWSELYTRRRDIQRRFGRVHALPLIKRVRHALVPHVREGARVLDVGAGARKVLKVLERDVGPVSYESVDPDTSGVHEHAQIADVTETYDVVVSFEVVEHVPPDQVQAWLADVIARVGDGGRLFLSTPNTYHPQEFQRDMTHRTPCAYDQLAGLVEALGLEVTAIHRVYADAWHRRILRRYVFGWLFRLLSLDYARQILITARRSA
ncbi:MAG: class I SAM-dependent methyltransferase [Planctomycetota bacterium]|nr:class I SAM-dependent methyltransferase [Planctomycetota bacterium]